MSNRPSDETLRAIAEDRAPETLRVGALWAMARELLAARERIAELEAETLPDRDGQDGTERLCRAVYGRPATARMYIGGSDARMLHDAVDRLALAEEVIEAARVPREEDPDPYPMTYHCRICDGRLPDPTRPARLQMADGHTENCALARYDAGREGTS